LFVQGKGGTNPFAVASSTGTQLLTVTQAGNVGIGTAAPTDKLQVSGNVYANAFNAVGNVSQYNSTGGVFMQGSAGSAYGLIRAYSDGAGTGKSLSLNDNGGNVGIGTITPTSTLFVQGSGGANPFVVASSSGAAMLTLKPQGYLYLGDGTTASHAQIRLNDASDNEQIVFAHGNTNRYTISQSATILNFASQSGGAGGLGQSFYFQGGTPDTSHQGSLFKITGNYNNAGQAIDGLLLNITNTSSAATSTLANLQVGGVSKFVVDISGNVNVATLTASSLVMSDAGKNLASVSLGSGLSLTGNVLNSTAANDLWRMGSGLIYNATSTDLVGIGTITPSTTLFVQGKGGTNPFTVASSSGTQFITVTQTGNVGIGTSTPGYAKLQVNAPSGNGNLLTLSTESTTVNNYR
jgi:hypothetical protein